MTENDISVQMKKYVDGHDMSGGALLVRQNNELVFSEKWGYANISTQEKVTYDSIYRMMSMSKPITAVCIMQLIEQGKLGLDDPVCKYIPGFANRVVAQDDRYIYDEKKLKSMLVKAPFFNLEKVRTVPAERDITIRDLLSHSSGLEQGMVGLMAMFKLKLEKGDCTLEERVQRYEKYPLDFQPGTGTSYSPIAGFDILGYIIQVVSGMTFEEYLQENLCKPLEMKDTTFFLSREQKKRLVHVYKRKGEKLIDVTDTNEDIYGFLRNREEHFEEGCGGLFSTVVDYEHFAQMLLDEGQYHGKSILKPKTVALMRTEGAYHHLEPEPGNVWGLGMKIRQDTKVSGSHATQGTFGWSGAFGTHFFVSPTDHLEAVFVTNRCDLNGSGSYISEKLEELVFGIYGENKDE